MKPFLIYFNCKYNTMKKIIITIIFFFLIINTSFANYKLENWSLNLVQKYNISTKNLWKKITRKEFVEILYKWYFDYKKDRWVNIDYSNYRVLDNSKIFTDIDLDSTFWKKLSYFAWLGAFSKNEHFNQDDTMNQKTFFIVMSRLRIIYSLQNCKYHKICEREADEKTLFLKWTYIKYVSKIMNKNIRKYYSSPTDYINAWYKPYLSSNYSFPLRLQTLNWCYAFSVRNILKYKDWIWIYIPKAEKLIWKKATALWNYYSIDKFNKLSHIEINRYYNIDTLISSLQAWEPVSVSYMLKYYSWKDKMYKYVPHIVAAYSFDENWVWVAETVKNKRVLVTWDKLFRKNWYVALNRIFKYYYEPKSSWSSSELDYEYKNNILVGEY